MPALPTAASSELVRKAPPLARTTTVAKAAGCHCCGKDPGRGVRFGIQGRPAAPDEPQHRGGPSGLEHGAVNQSHQGIV